jgi:hypothetical protein
MRPLLGFVPAIMILTISLANGKEILGGHYMEPKVYVTQLQIATLNVRAPVKHKRIVKSKIQRAQPFGIDDTDDVFVQEEDLAAGYRRRDLTKIEHPDGISEYVRWRLFLARQLALIKYREKWA